MKMHICPVCGSTHAISLRLHELSYGRQRTCGPRCKTAFRALVGSKISESRRF